MPLLQKSTDNFCRIIFDPQNNDHQLLISEYIATTNVSNNNDPKIFRLDSYNGVDGILFMILNQNTKKIDAVSSCIKDGNTAKVFHRLHLKPNVPHSVIDKFIEYETYDWCYKNDLKKLWFTVNEHHTETLFWVSKRVGERRHGHRPNRYKDGSYDFIRFGWRPHNKLIYERYTWQYAIYFSEDNTWFLNRKEKPLSKIVYNMFKKEYPNATQDW